MMSSKLLAFKLEKKISRSQGKKSKLFLEQTFLIFWGEWLIARKLVTQLNKQMNNFRFREEGRRGTLVTLNESMQPLAVEIWFLDHLPFPLPPWCLWPIVFPVVFGNLWRSTHFHRLCRLNNTLLPVSPLLPQGTTTYIGQNEGNGFDFLPLFTHQMEKENREHTLVLTGLDKQTPANVCV